MSSVNLMAGSGPVGEQTGCLARLSAAWCIGAILSPLLTTVLLTAVSPAMHLALFAPCFLVPLLSFRGESVQSIQATETAESGASSMHSGVSSPVILCTMAFMLRMFALFGVLLLRWQPNLLVASVIRAHEGTKPF